MSELTDRDQVVVEHIDTQMQDRKPVFDSNNQKIGEVKQFDLNAGYMQVHRGGLDPKTYYIPFHLIASIGPRTIFLKVSDDILIADYSLLPDSQTVLEQWTNWRTGQPETTVKHTLSSGYSGQQVIAFEQTYSKLAGQLIAGMQVRDIEGNNLGALHQFDGRQGWMLVVKSGLDMDILVIPFSVVGGVDLASSSVNLLIRKDSLQRDLAGIVPLPATSTTVDASTLRENA